MNLQSSAVAYLASKEKKVTPTAFERLAGQVKQDIQSNAFGTMLKFPNKKEKQIRSNNFDPVKRSKTVNAVNELRGQGVPMKKACSDVGVARSSYRHWATLLGIEFARKYPT
tara:strand:- start:3722 stop:4057 length:336 start_codon:yes stop_codon:yes gene_type:complete